MRRVGFLPKRPSIGRARKKAEFVYKCTEFYHGEDESGIKWDDEDIGIDWPLEGIDEIILSDKDKEWLSLKESQIRYE